MSPGHFFIWVSQVSASSLLVVALTQPTRPTNKKQNVAIKLQKNPIIFYNNLG